MQNEIPTYGSSFLSFADDSPGTRSKPGTGSGRSYRVGSEAVGDLQASELREGDGGPAAGERRRRRESRGTGKSEGIENRSHRSKKLERDGCEVREKGKEKNQERERERENFWANLVIWFSLMWQ